MSKDELFERFDVVYRQIDYYTNALRWVGLVHINEDIVHLSPFGRDLADMTHSERIGALARIIFSEPVFNFILHHPNRPVPTALYEGWRLKSFSTRARRVQTVNSWIRYFISQTELMP